MMHFHTRVFNGKLVVRLLGVMLMVMACFMALPAALSIYYDDGAQWGFMTSIVVVFFLGLFFRNIVGRLPNYDFHEKESFWITSVVWIVVPAVCSLPYMLTRTMQNPVEFSSVSTTVCVDLLLFSVTEV